MADQYISNVPGDPRLAQNDWEWSQFLGVPEEALNNPDVRNEIDARNAQFDRRGANLVNARDAAIKNRLGYADQYLNSLPPEDIGRPPVMDWEQMLGVNQPPYERPQPFISPGELSPPAMRGTVGEISLRPPPIAAPAGYSGTVGEIAPGAAQAAAPPIAPENPFVNAYAGPAGEYSDRYKGIVDQYRQDVASGEALRARQREDELLSRGLIPPSLQAERGYGRALAGPRAAAAAAAPKRQILKVGNSIVDAATGQVIYKGEPTYNREYLTPYEKARLDSAEKSYDDARKSYMAADKAWQKDANDDTIKNRIEAAEALRKAQVEFNSFIQKKSTPPIAAPAGTLVPPAAAAPAAPVARNRFYAGPQTQAVDENGFPLTRGSVTANDTFTGRRKGGLRYDVTTGKVVAQ